MSLTYRERTEAIIVAEYMMVKRADDRRVVQFLMKKYSIQKRTAELIVEEVIQTWSEESHEDRVKNRQRTLKVLGDLYQKAYQKERYSTCLQIERLRAQIENTIDMHQVALVVRDVEEDADRDETDYLFFARNGCWPEEWPDAPVQ